MKYLVREIGADGRFFEVESSALAHPGDKIKESDLSKISPLLERKAKFILRIHFWKGPKIIRDIPVSHWDLVIDSGKDYLDEWSAMEFNPLSIVEKGVAAIHKICNIAPPGGKTFKDWMTMEHIEIPPNHPEWGNPNKKIPAYMDFVDSGEVEWLEDSEMFSSFIFKGAKMGGYWTMKRESPDSDLWVLQKSSLPGQPKENIILENSDFPIEICTGGKRYQLIKTSQNKLRLDKKT